MTKQSEQQLLQRRFPIFTGLAMIICFAVFPLFLIDAAVNRVLQIQHENDLKSTGKKLESALDTLETFSDKKHFAHLLLNNAFTQALKDGDPAANLKTQLTSLKKKLPGIFLFVAWDGKGQIIREITDETSFAYILREVYRLLQDLADNCRQYYPGAPEKIPGFERRLKLVRNYIGRVVSLAWIQRPLQSGRMGSAIIAEPTGRKSHLWYGVNKEISMLAFIHSDFFVGEAGLEFAVRNLQKAHPELKAGYCKYPIDPETIYQYDSQTNPVDIALATSRFENLYPGSILHHENRVYSYRYISPTMRAFCHLPENAQAATGHRKRKMAATVIKWLLILAFLCTVAAKRMQLDHIPARFKLFALFLYAAGIPVLIIFIISADYLQQKRNELIYAAQSHAIEQLQQIDKGFTDYLKEMSDDIRRQLQRYIDINRPLAQQKAEMEKMRRHFIQRYLPGSTMLFATDGKNLFTTEGNMPFPDSTAISQVSKEILEFLNASDTHNFVLSQIARPMATDIAYKSLSINSFALGDKETYAFFSCVGRTQEYDATGMFYLFWRQEDLQKRYLEQAMREHAGFSAYFPETSSFLATKTPPGSALSSLLHKAWSLLVTRDAGFTNHGDQVLAAAIRGTNTHKSCMAAAISLAVIDKQMIVMYYKLALLSVLFLLFCGGGILMMRHRLLNPLQQFREAIAAIGQRNFRCRSALVGNNEFGKLSKALNHTLENLSELEVARIVQENLLPGREYRQNKLELLASLTQMSHIGGDYYDFFPVNTETSGIFVGDVSGHGISSALFMAMARSAMIFENFNEPDQEHLMQTLNNVIYQMRKSGTKEYMSGLSLFINSNTGQFSLLNAGHCPPAIIRKASGKVEFQMCKGIYFGFKREFTAQKLIGKLEPGDLIVLYTDSWVESVSKNDQAFGFPGFEQALLSCRDNDLELFSSRMFTAISTWEAKRSDDMTLLLIRFGEQHDS